MENDDAEHRALGVAVESAYTLTPTQSGLLAACVGGDDPKRYTSVMRFDIHGALDVERWQQSWQVIHRRHPALRSFFRWRGRPKAIQIVHRDPELDFALIDRPVDDGDLGFDLTRPPLNRHRVQRHGQQHFTHWFIFHHSLLDGWSTQHLIKEVLSYYHGETLPPTPAPFQDYVAWLADQDTAKDIAYWAAQLQGMPAPRLVRPTSMWGRQDGELNAQISSETWTKIRAVAGACRVTVNTIIMGAWVRSQAWFYGTDDVVTGFVDAGRGRGPAGIDAMAGLMLRTLPLRMRVNPRQLVSDFLTALQSSQQDAIQHGNVDSRLYPQIFHRDGDYASDQYAGGLLFDSVCVVQNLGVNAGSAEPTPRPVGATAITLSPAVYRDNAPFPLSLICEPGEALKVALHFDSQCIHRRDSERLLRLFTDCLDSLALDNQTEGGRREIGAWPAPMTTSASSPADISATHADQRIWQIASEDGERWALQCGERRWRYHELIEQIHRMVSHLVELGVAPGRVVALLMPNSDIAIMTMLAVARSGGAFCVIDPKTPAARLAAMLADLAATWDNERLVIVSDIAVDVAAQLEPATMRYRVIDSNALRQPSTTAVPTFPYRDDDLAYVIFTSGSTGRPKGVGISRANLAYSNNCRDRVYAEAPTRFLLLSALFFDSAMVGVFWTLTNGGELVIPSDGLDHALSELDVYIDTRAITHTLCLPSVHALLLRAPIRRLRSLTHVIVAGERCSASLVERHCDLLPGVCLYNEYGPTEATVWTTSHRLDNDPDRGRVSIGTPPHGTRVDVRDAQQRPVPLGALGELYIQGPGVSRGYLNLDEDTQARFVRSATGMSTMYASGDLGRYFLDGCLEYVGRTDDQIKLRGQRMELADVQCALAAADGVAQAAVVALDDDDHHCTGLWAHLELHDADGQAQSESRTAAIRAHLRAHLPATMMPTNIRVWSALPRLANGKIDLAALRIATRDSLEKEANHPAPPLAHANVGEPGDIDRTIAKLWRALFSMAPTDTAPAPTQDFFVQGGDSLSAVRLLIDINRQLGSRLTIADFYARPTPEGLAHQLRQQRRDGDWVSCIEFGAGDGPPMVFAYGNGQALSTALGPAHRVLWMVHGRGPTVVPTAPLPRLAEQHVDQLLALQQHGPYRLTGFSIGALLAIEMARLLHDAGHQVAPLVLIDPTSPAHYVPRSRLSRLQHALRRQDDASEKLSYLALLAQRTPGILRAKLAQRLRRTPQPARSTLIDIPIEAKHKHNILELVDGVMRDYVFTALPVPAHLIVIDRGNNALERADEVLMWRELAPLGLEVQTITTSGDHTELFRDAGALKELGAVLDTLLANAPAAT